MKLRIVTPLAVIVDQDDVLSLRAEDASGAFGILPRHTDFLTSLAISIVTWTTSDKPTNYCAVRGGVLTVDTGQTITVATREAVVSANLEQLDHEVLQRFRTERETERATYIESSRLHLNAIRQIMRYLRPGSFTDEGQLP